MDADKPYAELWMGTHPSAPSSVLLPSSSSPLLLSDYISSTLPYLFKILSIGTALSIQAHPDLPLAARLHASNPKEYRDDNHKPEMATAITEFEAMCGFRPHKEILGYLDLVPQLTQVVGQDAAAQYRRAVQSGSEEERKQGLKAVFAALMTAKEADYVPALHSLLDNLPQSDPFASPSTSSSSSGSDAASSLNVFALLPRLQRQYPDDIGIFCPFLLNSFRCSPFTSLFLPANEPHAYLSGDIVECMACSDNVVRAGLTPKFRDTANLVSMLTYKADRVQPLTPQQPQPAVTVFTPPIEEFALTIARPKVGAKAVLERADSHAILLVWKGEGTLRQTAGGAGGAGEQRAVKAGDVLFVPRDVTLELEAAGGAELIAFRCSENDAIKKRSKANL